MSAEKIVLEIIGWLSTLLFLVSIIVPNRIQIHKLGIWTSVTTGVYAYSHGATAIWIKWVIAFFFHIYAYYKFREKKPESI